MEGQLPRQEAPHETKEMFARQTAADSEKWKKAPKTQEAQEPRPDATTTETIMPWIVVSRCPQSMKKL